MKVILSVIAVTICLTLFGVQVACCYEDAPRPDKSTYDAMLRLMVERSESFRRKISASDPPPNTSGRGIMDYALVLGETRRFPERLARLFTLLGQMQDHDRASSNYGNMKWYLARPGCDRYQFGRIIVPRLDCSFGCVIKIGCPRRLGTYSRGFSVSVRKVAYGTECLLVTPISLL